MTKSIHILLLCVCLAVSLVVQACKSPTSGQTYNNDMFPLENGHQYTYSYTSISTTEKDKWIDSGTVSYLIKDSMDISTSLRAWVISQDINLVHKYYVLTDLMGGVRLDSSYLVQSTSTDTLKETLTGSHLLTAQFLIWQFPLRYANPPTMDFSRYSSSSDPVLTLYDILQSGPGNTVEHISTSKQVQYVFHNDIGLTSSSSDQILSSNVQYESFVIRVTLLAFSSKHP